MQDPEDFDVDFPFISVIATGAHTELILTRGVGLHTILGFDVDIAIGRMLDRCATYVS
jgi:tRNA A37 threonylcarbamoyltransferase TsaD